MSKNLIMQAEFLLSVSAETSVDKLRAMLKPFDPNRDIPILNRLNELYDGQNLNVLLRLALRYWTEGMDHEALLMLEQAQRINPDEQRVLRLALFFEVSFGSTDDARYLANHLLDLYPDDSWAATLKERLEVENEIEIRRVSMPPLEAEWE